jgi:elongation of very long chain fatty acids protein 6
VLRKQKLIFLHWYHHATVLVYCWYSAKDFSGSGRWFVLMNYTVHSAMYSYYALRALRFKIPKWVNITITSGQILQMVFGIYINCVAWYQIKSGAACHVSVENIVWSFIMYFSYFLLFFKFFYDAYLAGPKPKKLEVANGKCANGSSNGHVTKTNGHSNGYHNINGKKVE